MLPFVGMSGSLIGRCRQAEILIRYPHTHLGHALFAVSNGPGSLGEPLHGSRESDWGKLSAFYSHKLTPAIDPEMIIWMLIVGYVFTIRSERRLCAEARVNLAYRWLCGLSIDDRIADHLAFSCVCFEHFRQADVLRQVFESVVESI